MLLVVMATRETLSPGNVVNAAKSSSEKRIRWPAIHLSRPQYVAFCGKAWRRMSSPDEIIVKLYRLKNMCMPARRAK